MTKVRIELSPGQLRAVLAIVGRYVDETEPDEDCLIYQANIKLSSSLIEHELNERR